MPLEKSFPIPGSYFPYFQNEDKSLRRGEDVTDELFHPKTQSHAALHGGERYPGSKDTRFYIYKRLVQTQYATNWGG